MFDPDNQAVLTELRRLERGERLRRWAIGAGALAVLATMAIGALFLARKALSEKKAVVAVQRTHEPSRKPTPTQRPHASKPPAETPHPSGRVATTSRGPSHARRQAAADKPVPRPEESGAAAEGQKPPAEAAEGTAEVPTITLALGFTPARVEVWMDGKKAFDYGPQQNRLTIPWDQPHRLEFRNDSCCNRKVVMVGPQLYRPPGDHLFVNLDPKPARLVVTLDPPLPGATLLIREVNDTKPRPWRARAQPGEKITVPFDEGDEMRKSLEVLAFKGDMTATNQVTITAGEIRPVTMQMGE